MTSLTPVDILLVLWLSGAAATVIGFTLGFSQALVKDLRRWFRRYRRAHRMGPPGGSYGRQPLVLAEGQTTPKCPDPPEQFIRMDPGPIQRGNGSGGPTTPKPQIVPKGQHARHEYINNPAQKAECGGPCSQGARYCDCGELWLQTPTTRNPPSSEP